MYSVRAVQALDNLLGRDFIFQCVTGMGYACVAQMNCDLYGDWIGATWFHSCLEPCAELLQRGELRNQYNRRKSLSSRTYTAFL